MAQENVLNELTEKNIIHSIIITKDKIFNNYRNYCVMVLNKDVNCKQNHRFYGDERDGKRLSFCDLKHNEVKHFLRNKPLYRQKIFTEDGIIHELKNQSFKEYYNEFNKK